MSDNNDKPKKTIPAEQLARMQVAAKAAREKRAADEAANPELKEKRLAEAKAKREAKKASKSDSDEEKPKKAAKADGSGSDNDEAPKKRVSWWSTATEEQKDAAKAKAKAKREAKKAFEAGDLDDDVPEDATSEDIKKAAAAARKHKGKKD